jgi:hypothetical protein
MGEGDNREEVDVEVNVTRCTAREQSHCDTSGSGHYDYFYDGYYPAGASLEECTSTAPAYHDFYVGTTAEHCYYEGQEVWQPTDGSYEEKCGVIQQRKYWREDSSPQRTDLAFLTFETHRDARYYLAANTGDNDYDEYIAGLMNWDAIVDMEDTDQIMYRQGGRTGRCQGNVIGAYGGYNVKNFDSDAYSMGGDSGGPHFVINSHDHAYLAGSHWGRPTSDRCRAIFLEDNYNELNLSFR